MDAKTMDAISSSTVHSRVKTIEDYSTIDDITAEVEAFESDNFILAQTNEVLERYLRKRSPTLLIGMDRFFDTCTHSGSTRRSYAVQPLSLPRQSMASTSSSPSPVATPVVRMSTTSSSGNRGVGGAPRSSLKISPAVKADLVERELEENRMTMEKLERKFESAKFLLQTEEENLRIEIEVLEKSKIDFEEFLSQSTDPKTGKVYHDKFLRYIDLELKAGDRHLRNNKLKAKSLHTEFKRLKSQQHHRMELRERLHPIDIDKLLIENQEQLDILEVKNKNFENLKRVVGRKGQTLVSIKSKLVDTVVSLKGLKQDLGQKEYKSKYIEEQEILNQHMLKEAEDANKDIKNIVSEFKSPDVHSYLLVQSKLKELKLDKDTWERRCKYQKQLISLLEHQVKQLSPPRKSHFPSHWGRSTAYSLPMSKLITEHKKTIRTSRPLKPW